MGGGLGGGLGGGMGGQMQPNPAASVGIGPNGTPFAPIGGGLGGQMQPGGGMGGMGGMPNGGVQGTVGFGNQFNGMQGMTYPGQGFPNNAPPGPAYVSGQISAADIALMEQQRMMLEAQVQAPIATQDNSYVRFSLPPMSHSR